jgi:hypothetical protein
MSDELRLEIDQMKLDKEWADQPLLYHEWSLKAAHAQNRHDEEKSKLDIVQAELDRDIRANPSAFELGKITETVISNTVILQPEYQAQTRRVQSAKHDLDIMKAAIGALDHRKRALTLLVELWIRDYYSNPQLSTSRQAIDELNKQEARSRGRRREEDSRNDDIS